MTGRDDLEGFLAQRSEFISLSSLVHKVGSIIDKSAAQVRLGRARRDKATLLDQMQDAGMIIDELKRGKLRAFAYNKQNGEVLAIDSGYWDDGGNALAQRGVSEFFSSDNGTAAENGRQIVLKRKEAEQWLAQSFSSARPQQKEVGHLGATSGSNKRSKPQALFSNLPPEGKWFVDEAVAILVEIGGLKPPMKKAEIGRKVLIRAAIKYGDWEPSPSSIKRYINMAIERYEHDQSKK